MKVAICLSGGIKYPELSIKGIKKLRDKYDCSIFIHTWSITNTNSFIENSANSQILNNSNEYYISQYSPTSVNIGNFDIEKEKIQSYFNDLKFQNMCPTTHGIGPLSMFYSIEQSNNIKKQYELNNKMKFDCVVRMRFDSDIQSEIEFENFDLSKLNVPIGRDYDGLNDQFAFGNTNIMDLYSITYSTLPFLQKTLYHPEHILKQNIEYHKIEINRVNIFVEINNGRFQYH